MIQMRRSIGEINSTAILRYLLNMSENQALDIWLLLQSTRISQIEVYLQFGGITGFTPTP